jgi:hypothetical protein
MPLDAGHVSNFRSKSKIEDTLSAISAVEITTSLTRISHE